MTRMRQFNFNKLSDWDFADLSLSEEIEASLQRVLFETKFCPVTRIKRRSLEDRRESYQERMSHEPKKAK